MLSRSWATPLLLSLLATVFAGCSQNSDDSGSGSDGDSAQSEPGIRLAGTVATGRPGQWAEVCLASECSRADGDGDYRLSGDFEDAAFLTAEIPNADGSTTELASLFQPDGEQTTYLININPLTDAVLDAWSYYREGESLSDCRDTPACEQTLLDNFTAEVQSTAITQLADWADDYWETLRDPFSDPYLADPSLDWLDNLFDHLHFDVDETGLAVIDNDDFELGRMPLDTLFEAIDDVLPLDDTLVDQALAIAPVDDGDTVIEIRYDVSPGTAISIPEDVSVDASQSRSPGGELTFVQEWIQPDGTATRFTSAQASARIESGGMHHWVITATDSQGNRHTDGFDIDAETDDVIDDPDFGGDGSCQTIQMTANSKNICEETIDGGALGTCEPTDSGSTLTQYTPSPCSPIEQNGGRFLGVCTVVLNEIRVFHYENPLRNTGLTLDELRALEAEHCTDVFGGRWSTEVN